MSPNQMVATTPSPASSTRVSRSWRRGVVGAPRISTSPASAQQGRVPQQSMTVVNISRYDLRLARIDGAVAADSLPPVGVLVPRGEQLSFDLVPSRDMGESLVAHFEIVDAPGPVCAHPYPVAISPDASDRAARMLPEATGSPVTQVHLTQDLILLRNSIG